MLLKELVSEIELPAFYQSTQERDLAFKVILILSHLIELFAY